MSSNKDLSIDSIEKDDNNSDYS